MELLYGVGTIVDVEVGLGLQGQIGVSGVLARALGPAHVPARAVTCKAF